MSTITIHALPATRRSTSESAPPPEPAPPAARYPLGEERPGRRPITSFWCIDCTGWHDGPGATAA